MELAAFDSSGAKNFEVACRLSQNVCTSGHDHIVWECDGVTLLDVMLTGLEFNSDTYNSVMKELRCFSLTRNQRKSSFSMTVQGRTQVWRLRNPSQNVTGQCYYSPELAPSDFHLHGVLKDVICCTKFETDDVICTVGTLLFEQDKAWYWESVHTLVPQRKAVEVGGDVTFWASLTFGCCSN